MRISVVTITAGLSAALAVTTGIAHAQCETAKLIAPDGTAGDRFGGANDISGETLLIGARHDGAGSAYAYRRTGNTWIFDQKLTPSDPTSHFGWAVAVDGTVAVIGAPYDSINGTQSGAAYVFVYHNDEWLETVKLYPHDPDGHDLFGRSVSVLGQHIIIGARGDDDDAMDSGAAYVFEFDGAAWVEAAKLKASDSMPGDWFGDSVTLTTDLAIIGATRSDAQGPDSGAAYAFRFDGLGWIEEDKLTASDGQAEDYFGRWVSADGDTVVIGAPSDDDNGNGSGSAYVFSYAGYWDQQAKLLPNDGVPDQEFGFEVAIDNGVIIVGAHYDPENGYRAGAAYVYSTTATGSWTQVSKLTAQDAAPDDRYGNSLAIEDGIAVIGANLDDDQGSMSGSAYLFAVAGADCNDNSAIDTCDITEGTSFDCQANGIPDECEWDSDGDGDIDDCDADDDDDGILDDQDNCPVTPNVAQDDLDEDNIGDACDADIDGDGIDNDTDNCPLVANLGQDDTDMDGDGDACDEDDDDDGVLDGDDNCALIYNPSQADTDGDGDGDVCDGDLDGDGVDNDVDNCPTTANGEQNDFDEDGAGDACDGDIDDDGVPTGDDVCEFTPLGELVDPATGCSLEQLCPCEGPRGTTVDWKNHGKYVSCVAQSTETFVDAGLITENEKGDIVSQAAQSECGHKD